MNMQQTCKPQQPIAFIIDALCTTLYEIPSSLALKTRSVWVVALKFMHVMKVMFGWKLLNYIIFKTKKKYLKVF